MRILYLGLDPSRFVHSGTLIHYPILRIVPLQSFAIEEMHRDWSQFTHVIVTSRTSFRFLPTDFRNKQLLAIGPATLQAAQQTGAFMYLAPDSTQEGVIALLETLDLRNSYILYPRSSLARDALQMFLQKQTLRAQIVDLYKAVPHQPGPLPDLGSVDQIVFTSPSTVDAFLQIFGPIPFDKKITSIGPITASKIAEIAPLFYTADFV